jgi:hypothetical protein
MNAPQIEKEKDPPKAAWYENHYVCSECNSSWIDEWSCMCNDRCPECDSEIQPTSSTDLSRPRTNEDYQGAARLISAACGEAAAEVTPEDAKAYAEAIMEGGDYRFSPARWEAGGA